MADFVTDFKGSAAIITGAGAGIGEAIAIALARAGAAVVINDINPDRVDTLVESLQHDGFQAAGFQGDVSNRFQAAALIETARDAFGRINILINAAGVYKPEPIMRIDEWDWRRQVEVNISGTFFCTQLISRVMADEGGGCIINIASTAGHPGTLPEGVGYVTTKAAVVAMTKQSARELAPHNIRVNAICPGHIHEPDMPASDAPTNALCRMGSVDEVAGVALFLCSDAAGFVVGQAINIDGGDSMV